MGLRSFMLVFLVSLAFAPHIPNLVFELIDLLFEHSDDLFELLYRGLRGLFDVPFGRILDLSSLNGIFESAQSFIVEQEGGCDAADHYCLGIASK